MWNMWCRFQCGGLEFLDKDDTVMLEEFEIFNCAFKNPRVGTDSNILHKAYVIKTRPLFLTLE